MERGKIVKELNELETLKVKVKESLAGAPGGRMRSEMAKGKYPQFYEIKDELVDEYPRGKYIRKEDMYLAKQYAQKEYDSVMLEEIAKRERKLKAMLEIEDQNMLNNVFLRISEAKRSLINPYILSDKEYIALWESTRLGEENRYPIINGFSTEKGETVRSKSEKMIADKLFLKGIPYKYEAPLKLKANRIIYPDFTMLNIRTREEIYLEHFGMMDNPEYCKSAIEKIEEYEECGIQLGKNLLVSFESSLKPINIRSFDGLVNQFVYCKSE